MPNKVLIRLSAAMIALVAIVFLVSPALAQGPNGNGAPSGARPPIAVGSGWQAFSWSSCGGFNVEGAFTFTASGPFILKITDAYIDGDRFNVYNFGTLVGTTSVPVDDGSQIGANPDAAFTDPRYSHGAVGGGPGSYSLTFKTIQCATGYSSGGAYFRVDPASPSDVPEADTLLLTSGGIGGLATWLGWQWRKARARK